MFERYTEKARRVVFFARYEASQYGSSSIETEHLLLGLLREDKPLGRRVLRGVGDAESIRKEIDRQFEPRERISTSVEMPLTNECKQVLNYAAEEAQAFGHNYIGAEHLLLGLLRVENSMAARILTARGVNLEKFRPIVKQWGEQVEQFAKVTNLGLAPVRYRQADIGRTLEQNLKAWKARDMSAIVQCFAPLGHLWNLRGELSVGHKQIEKEFEELAPLFETFPAEPSVKDILPVRSGATLITLEWKNTAPAMGAQPHALRILLAITDEGDTWSIASAHLFYLQPTPS